MKALICFFLLSWVIADVTAQNLVPFEQNSKWGFRERNGKVVIPAQFGTAEPFITDGLARVGNKEGGAWKYGMIDLSGNPVIPIQFEKLGYRFSSGLLIASQNGKWGFLDKSGKIVVPVKYQSAESFSENLAAVQLDGKWGFIDPSGSVKIPFIYSRVTSFAKQHSKVNLGTKTGFIDQNGKNLGEIKYDEIYFGHMAANLFGARINDKYAVINLQGKELTGFIYDEASPNFDDRENYIVMRTGDKWCAIDDKGTTIIPPKYDNLIGLNDKLLLVSQDEKWGMINLSNKLVLPVKYIAKPEVNFNRLPQGTFIEDNKRKSFYIEGDRIRMSKYDHMDEESEGRRAVYYQNKAGFINNRGEEVIPLKYDSVGQFIKGLAPVASGGKFGFTDTTGKERIAVKYNMIDLFREDLALVASNNKWGFVDQTGTEVIPLVYETAGPFVEGMAAVMLNKKIGFINHAGKMVIQPQFDALVQMFQYGRAVVIKNGKEITIDKSGNSVNR